MIRRLLPTAMIGAGLFLLVLAVLLPLVVYPRLAVLPLDPQTGQTVRGTGFKVFVPRSDEEGGLRSYRDATVTADVYVTEDRSQGPRPQDSPNANWRVATTTTVAGVGVLQTTIEIVSLDRRTALTNNCCSDALITEADDTLGSALRHEGYAFMFPFNTQRTTYPVWDVSIGAAAPAVYRGTQERRGLRTYRFEQEIPDQKIGTQDLPGSVFGLRLPSVRADSMYRTVRTFWVEPATGAMIDYRQVMDRRFVFDGQVLPVIQGTLQLVPEDGAAFDLIKRAAAGLPLVRRTLPMIFGPLGLLLSVLGVAGALRAAGRNGAEDYDYYYDRYGPYEINEDGVDQHDDLVASPT